MKFKTLSLLFLGSALSIGCLTACDSDAPTSAPEEVRDPNAPVFDAVTGTYSHPDDTLGERLPARERIESLLKELGYTDYEFRGNYVVLEGDMLMHRSDFMSLLSPQTAALGKTAQRFHSWESRVDRSRTYQIDIRPGRPGIPDFSDNWKQGIKDGLEFWRLIGKIQYRIVSSGGDMYIFPANLGKGKAGEANKPTPVPGQWAKPGQVISINTTWYGAIATRQQAAATMRHFFGHAFGFEHTDGAEGFLIKGTFPDPKSFMNNKWGYDVTPYDVKAIRTIYP